MIRKKIKVGNKWIGDGEPTFIIAEAGSNHNRDFQMAKDLIDVAASAKADAVKFQLFKAEKHYPQITPEAGKKSRFQMTKEKELPEEWVPELAKYCAEKGILFLCTAFNESAVDILNPYVSSFKIASSEMTHYPLIQYAAKTNKSLIISCGMANLNEVDDLFSILRSTNKKFSLMHCTVSYPTEMKDANLKVITTFRNKYNVPIGISDHTRNPFIVPVAAVALGVNMVEKHFTLSNSLPGADHSYAVEPQELKNMVKAIREAEIVLGSDQKKVIEAEANVRKFLRRTIFAVKDINKGDKFSKDNIDILRADDKGMGLEPKEYDNIIGKKSKGTIKAFELIKLSDFAK